MQEAKHTAIPWAVEKGEGHHRNSIVITARHAGMTPESPLAHISTVLGEEDALPDARHIVHCVNCHDELLEALERVLPYLMDDAVSAQGQACRKARAVIAQATQQKDAQP